MPYAEEVRIKVLAFLPGWQVLVGGPLESILKLEMHLTGKKIVRIGK
nr:hypothetical protein [Yersinia enterocolitica]